MSKKIVRRTVYSRAKRYTSCCKAGCYNNVCQVTAHIDGQGRDHSIIMRCRTEAPHARAKTANILETEVLTTYYVVVGMYL